MWVIKENGQSWTVEHFQYEILLVNVISCLRIADNVLDIGNVALLHDNAPCFRALRTQQLLRDHQVALFDSTQWPSNSLNLNACENIGSIMKNKVELIMHNQRCPNRYSIESLRIVIL